MNKCKGFSRLWSLVLLFGAFMAGCASNGDQIPIFPNTVDTVAPTVSVTSPTNGAVSVPINRKVSVAFSEGMAPATINAATFTLTGPGTTPVTGVVTPTGNSATFTPGSPGAPVNLANNTIYTCTITTGVKDLAGNPMASNFVFTFETGSSSDIIPPTVSITSPTNTAVAVPNNRKVTVGFSEMMDPASITTASFTLTGPGTTPVTGVVTAVGTSAIFTPSSNLASNTLYTATITTGAKDLAGNAMASNFPFTFTTGVTVDTTKPTVTATINANGAINVPTNTKVGATFSETMNPLTLNPTTFTFKQGSVSVPGIITYSGMNVVFTPTTNLANNTVYTATVTTAATDLAGNGLLADYVWTFTTGGVVDTTPPAVTLVNPADLAINVAVNSAVHATFSKAMDPLTVSTATFTLSYGAAPITPVTGVVTYDALSKIATFTPSSPLVVDTTYTATITTGAMDLAGNAILSNYVWSFTTAATPIVTPTVTLGGIATYGTFGGTAGMTNQGILTIVNGDIGTIATTTSTVTGFHDTENDIFTQTTLNAGTVNGTIYTCTTSTTGPTSAAVNVAYCDLAKQARLDAQAAYLALSLMPSTGVLAGNLSGLTIFPGVYTNASTVQILGSDLTLDGQGDANALFVFQIGSSLTVGGPSIAAARSIILTNGAQAKNVYWQVGSSATINPGGGGTMVGTIITQDGLSFSTAGMVELVTFNGRAISLGASVTMVNTIINVPAP